MKHSSNAEDCFSHFLQKMSEIKVESRAKSQQIFASGYMLRISERVPECLPGGDSPLAFGQAPFPVRRIQLHNLLQLHLLHSEVPRHRHREEVKTVLPIQWKPGRSKTGLFPAWSGHASAFLISFSTGKAKRGSQATIVGEVPQMFCSFQKLFSRIDFNPERTSVAMGQPCGGPGKVAEATVFIHVRMTLLLLRKLTRIDSSRLVSISRSQDVSTGEKASLTNRIRQLTGRFLRGKQSFCIVESICLG